MRRPSAATRISLGVTCVTVGLIYAAQVLWFLPITPPAPVIVVGACGFFAYRFYLQRALRRMDSSRRARQRIKAMLNALETTDPLTACVNRRTFFATLETHWSSAKRYGHPLACLMVDVDHLRRINEQHGHGGGDQALRHVADTLRTLSRDTDIVCRYGGEEFVVLLPQVNIDGAAQAAERIRAALQSRPCVAGIRLTVSVGVSGAELNAPTPQALLEQADQAVCAAKRGGRNRAVRCDALPNDPPAGTQAGLHPSADSATSDGEASMPIPFHAVTALMSALAHRHAATAVHSQRVADLCIATAKGLLSLNDCFLLEVAALLHDIGKLGVPDAILLKPGALTEEEWKVMRSHDQMGVEIISAAFGSTALTDIVRNHHACFDGDADSPGLPMGTQIPIGARILTIADAYDAMVSHRPYHQPKTREQAFAELRRCAGRQFDPQLVERLITAVQSGDRFHAAGPAAAAALPSRTALRIRLEIERLACALDAQDLSALAAMAQRLAAVASKDGLPEIAEVASALQQTTLERDLESALTLTNELLELCSSPQTLDARTLQPPAAARPPARSP